MNFLVVYSVVLIMVATISTANKVEKAFQGVQELRFRYLLHLRYQMDGKSWETVAPGSIVVSTETVVEYSDEVGFVVTNTKLLDGVDANEKEYTYFKNVKPEDIQSFRHIEAVDVKGNHSSTPSENRFKAGASYTKNVYLVDVSNIKGAELFKTYDFEANNTVWKEPPVIGKTQIVRYDKKLYAQIYLPNAAKYKIKLVTPVEGGDNFPTTLANEKSIGGILV